MAHVSTRAQLLCLRHYLEDPALARDIDATWIALTQACHYHPYEFPPTSGELLGWLERVDAAIRLLHGKSESWTTLRSSRSSSRMA
jgi:hypothetical protein